MTINEIESTLQTLASRHPNLDEVMLVTLLTAGGWEEKIIKDAVAVFRSSVQKGAIVELPNSVAVLPKVETRSIVSEGISVPISTQINNEVVLNDVIKVPQTRNYNAAQKAEANTKIDSLQNDGYENKISQSPEIVYFDNKGEEEHALQNFSNQEVELPKVELLKIKEVQPDLSKVNELILPIITEPQSLIEPDPETKSSNLETELPDNLPLKPFESAPHVWPFSKYKEVFYGEAATPLPPEERVLVKSMENQNKPEQIIKKVKIKRTGFDGEDESLIFLTGTTLFIILLLLAYMYSNGRI